MSFKFYYIKEQEEAFDFGYFKSLSSVSLANKYAKSKLPKLGTGSSRDVYLYDGKALKVAKNAKGLSQNGAEGDYGLNRMYPDIIPKLYDTDDENDKWILVAKAEKVLKSEFKKLIDMTFDQFSEFVMYAYDISHGGKYIQKMPPQFKEILDDENSFGYQLSDLMGNFDVHYGDFRKLSSFGKIDNKLVIVDCGFTNTVLKTHYSR